MTEKTLMTSQKAYTSFSKIIDYLVHGFGLYRRSLRSPHRQILHIFASFLKVFSWIISIYHYIDSIPQFLRIHFTWSQ